MEKPETWRQDKPEQQFAVLTQSVWGHNHNAQEFLKRGEVEKALASLKKAEQAHEELLKLRHWFKDSW